MPNNPVQIILNDRDFLAAPEPGRGGPEKDFFEDDDPGFARHRDLLVKTAEDIKKAIKAAPYGPAAYLKIQLRTQALAKSYRPSRYLFTEDLFPCVGADGVGTLYYRAPLIYLPHLIKRIEEAETKVRVLVNRNTQKQYKAPSRARSEVGAIETIEIAPAEEKRLFSTAEAIKALQDPMTVSGYNIELFETPAERVIADDPLGREALRKSLEKTFLSLGSGARAVLAPSVGSTPVIELQLTRSDVPALIENRIGAAGGDIARRPAAEIDLSIERHDAALSAIAAHPLVRAILPPVQLQIDDTAASVKTMAPVALPQPSASATYPIVGVIDTGVAKPLDPWVIDRFDFLNTADINPSHGTTVAGLIAIGQTINDPSVTPEPSGCMIYDAPLYPKGAFEKHYPNLFLDFLEEIEQAVAEASEQYGVRIFNLSINATSAVERYRYSIYASRLDDIADRYGVVFVNSAGNLKPNEARAPWPHKPSDAVKYFAQRTQSDTINKPAESVRAISVGALNPPGGDHISGAPTVYTRRGPGLQVGVKPDVAAYGGSGGKKSGLQSITPDGALSEVAGTSFAAPLIARSLAGVDHLTEGALGEDGLRAMLLHHATMPDVLLKRGIGPLGRQFAGFGMPCGAAEMLETDDHQITLFFESRLTVNQSRPAILRFPFEWPPSLTNPDGACSGRAKMTLVFSPPLDPAFGAEFVRVNLEASLLQRQAQNRKDGKPSFNNQITARYMPKRAGLGIPEKALIDHGLKWWPAKQYDSTFIDKGESSSWRLEVTSLVRAEARFPPEGVPFAVLLTIEDPDGKKPVFQQMQQALQASRADARPIKTVARLRPRGR